jgi:hypothetical protein
MRWAQQRSGRLAEASGGRHYRPGRTIGPAPVGESPSPGGAAQSVTGSGLPIGHVPPTRPRTGRTRLTAPAIYPGCKPRPDSAPRRPRSGSPGWRLRRRTVVWIGALSCSGGIAGSGSRRGAQAAAKRPALRSSSRRLRVRTFDPAQPASRAGATGARVPVARRQQRPYRRRIGVERAEGKA